MKLPVYLDMKLSLIEEAAYFAISKHGNQTYDGYPYYYHLEQVVEVLKEFGYGETKYIVSGYLHDILEDTEVSYNDIKKMFGKEIAEIVYAVTDELGKNRKERKSKTLPKIASNKDAIIIKLADRIANMRNSLKKNHSMMDAYIKEFDEFYSALYIEGHADSMWNEIGDSLDSLIAKTI